MKKKKRIIVLIIVSVFIVGIAITSLVMFLPRSFGKLIPEENIASIQCKKQVYNYIESENEYLFYELQTEKYNDFFNLVNELKFVKQNYFTLTPLLDAGSITIVYNDGTKIVFSMTNFGLRDKDGNNIKKHRHDLTTSITPIYNLFDQEIPELANY